MSDDAAREKERRQMAYRCAQHEGRWAHGYCVRCEEMAKLKAEGALALLREKARVLLICALLPDGNGHVHCPVCGAWTPSVDEPLRHIQYCAAGRVEGLLPENKEVEDG